MIRPIAMISVGTISKILAKDPLYSHSNLLYEICDEKWPESNIVADKRFFNDISVQVILNILFVLNPDNRFPLRRLATLFPLDYFATGSDLSEWWYENEQERSRWLIEVSKHNINYWMAERFFTIHKLPYPYELFPNKEINSRSVFERLFQSVPTNIVEHNITLSSVRSVIQNMLTIQSPIAEVLDAPVIEIPNISAQPDQAGTPSISSDEKKNIIAIYNAELNRLWSEDYQLWQRVHCYFKAYANGTSNKDLVEIVSKRNGKNISERTIIRWIGEGKRFAVEDPAGPNLPSLEKPIHRRK